jgi:hypothetical protein
VDSYTLDDKPIKITDANASAKGGGFVTAKYQIV